MGDFYSAIDWVAALIAAVALVMVVLGPRDVKAARAILGAAAALTLVRWIMWSFTTDSAWLPRALVGGLIGAVLLGGMPALWQWAREREKSSTADSNRGNAKNLDYKFTMHCDWDVLRDFDRTDGKRLLKQQITYVPQDPDPPFIGSGAFSTNGGSYRALHPTSPGYKCYIKNDSDQIVTGAYATMKIWFKTLTKTDDGKDQWNTIYSGTFDTPILTLHPLDEDFSILSNISPYYVSITLPKEINVRVAGSGEYQVVKLTPSDNAALDLLAFDPRPEFTNPPSPALQDPAPLVLPEKK